MSVLWAYCSVCFVPDGNPLGKFMELQEVAGTGICWTQGRLWTRAFQKGAGGANRKCQIEQGVWCWRGAQRSWRDKATALGFLKTPLATRGELLRGRGSRELQ